MNVRPAVAAGMQTEATDETETVQDLAALSQAGDEPVVYLLIQVKTGLVAGQQIGFESQAIENHWHWTG